MTTLFDIGEEIELTLTGTITSYSKTKNGDCYVVVVKDKHNKDLPVYLDTESLIAANAHIKIEKPEGVECSTGSPEIVHAMRMATAYDSIPFCTIGTPKITE